MRFPPSLLDEIRARLPVSQVVGRTVRLQRRGREYVGLSPFKTEKTPSFTVNDQKCFYHCFSSGEHGDIFKFVMETEGLSFSEAVERLAQEAGVELPKATPAMVEQEAERDRLMRVVAASETYFCAKLAAPSGRETRDYIAGRNLSPEVVATFGIGFAPDDRQGLRRHLQAAGFSDRDMSRSGMVIAGPDIREPYDRFRNRLIFPIRDLRGRTIAFGGRALSAEQRAKYLNSPETPLFHKGNVLFHADFARKAAHGADEIVVCEGYMDVIAMHRAGIPQAVAPLGTALTEQQLQLLWRMADEPTLSFDGDAAGRKAAVRALELALAHLQPGRSLRFAFMPNGLDPDDLLNQSGAQAVRGVIDAARPLVDVLWQSAWDRGDWSTPERRAALKAELLAKVASIAHPDVRKNYERDLYDRLWQAFSGSRSGARPRLGRRVLAGNGPRRGAGGTAPGGRPQANQVAQYSGSLTGSNLVAAEGIARGARDALILRTLINHPWLLDSYAEHVARLRFSSPPLSDLRDCILAQHTEHEKLDSLELKHHLERLGRGRALAAIARLTIHEANGFSRPDAPADVVGAGWRECLIAWDCEALDEAIEEARSEAERSGEPEMYDHLMALRNERERLERLPANVDH